MEKHCESKKRFGKELKGVAGKGAVLERFLRESGGAARQFAFKLCGDEQEAQELVQEASRKALLALRQYDDSRPLLRWFFSIVRNVFVDERRRFVFRKTVSMDAGLAGYEGLCIADTLAEPGTSVLARLEREEEHGMARRALNGLRSEFREVLTLRDMEGRRYEDIALSLGIPVGTVRSRLFRGRQALRVQSPELAALAN